MAVVVPLSNSKVALTVIAILVIIFVTNFVMPLTSEQGQCEEKGGKWASTLGGGCGMSSEACEDAGGIPVEYLSCRITTEPCPTVAIPGCEFR